jgi:hypothetical protein
MPDLPGHEFRPHIQEIPDYADAEKLAAAMRDGSAMRPGEIRYARTTDDRIPSPYTVENACFILAIEKRGEPDENGAVELHSTLLTDLGPNEVLNVLYRTAQEVIEICEHGKASRN